MKEACIRWSYLRRRLIRLGADINRMSQLEDAYWSLVINPVPSQWDNADLFLDSDMRVNVEMTDRALEEYRDPYQLNTSIVAASLFDLLHLASGKLKPIGWDEGSAREFRKRRFSQFLSYAAFVALARSAGVPESNQEELEVHVAFAVIQLEPSR